MPTFQALLQAVETVPGVVLKISIFYTRASISASARTGSNSNTKIKSSTTDEYGYGVGAETTYAKRGLDFSSGLGFKEKPGSKNRDAEISVLPADSPDAIINNDKLITDDRITIQPGRPVLTEKLEAAAYFATQLTSSSPSSGHRRRSGGNGSRGRTMPARGVAVGVCGPGSLVSDVSAAARKVPTDIRKACGGVEVHEE